jgi:hypothetical protein
MPLNMTLPEATTESKALERAIPQKASEPRRRWLLRTGEFLILLLIAVVALETFFKFAGIGEQEFLEPDRQLGARHIPGKLVTWRMEGYSHDKLSSTGLRDSEHSIAKPAGITRIALLGDSSTEGMQVPLNETYGKVLERLLYAQGQKYEVINFACSSYSTGQQVLQYERDVRQYHPDIVLLLYNRGDSIENIFVPGPAALSQPRPYFYLDAQNNLQMDTSVLEACSSKLPNPFWDYLKENSRIYGVISATGLVLSINEHNYRKWMGWLTAFTNSFVKNDRPSTWTIPYAKQNPDSVTEALLKRLNRDVTTDGAKFALIIFPNVVQDPDLQRQQSLFEMLANRNGFAFFDLTRPFFDADFHSYFLEYHFSSKGHDYVAHQLLPLIEKLTPPSKPANDQR